MVKNQKVEADILRGNLSRKNMNTRVMQRETIYFWVKNFFDYKKKIKAKSSNFYHFFVQYLPLSFPLSRTKLYILRNKIELIFYLKSILKFSSLRSHK